MLRCLKSRFEGIVDVMKNQNGVQMALNRVTLYGKKTHTMRHVVISAPIDSDMRQSEDAYL